MYGQAAGAGTGACRTQASPQTARLLLALIALAAYPHAVPQLTRLVLGTHSGEQGDSTDHLDAFRDFLADFARSATDKLSG